MILSPLFKVYVDGLIDNNEKVVSSLKLIQIKTRVQKPYPIYEHSGWNAIPFGAAHTYIAHID